MTKRTYDEKIKNTSLGHTNTVYVKAVANLGLTHLSRQDREGSNEEAVGKEYIRIIRTLPSRVLEMIIQDHLGKIVRRDENTIEEVLAELAHRILIEGEEDETSDKRHAE